MLKKISIILALLLILPHLAEAKILCNLCYVGYCECEITDCNSGIIDIFLSTSCSTTPDYEIVFSEGYFTWEPSVARSYSAIALCSDGRTTSGCSTITVNVKETTTTTLKPTTTTIKTTTTIPEEIVEERGPDYLLIALIITLLVLIGVAVYYFFFTKRKKKKSFEELYRKWGGRR